MRREKVTLNAQLRADLATMEINIKTDQRTIAGVILSAGELDAVMAALADIRSKMMPEVPEAYPTGKPVHQHNATKYVFGFDPFAQKFLLSFRSPGFGWLSFAVDPAEVEKMNSQMKELKSRPAMPHSDKKQ